MSIASHIPSFNLYGETDVFPDVIHRERIWARARLHDWQIAPHRHANMVQLFWMQQGRAEAQVDGESFALESENFLYVPAQAIHGFNFTKGSEGEVLSFPLILLSKLEHSNAELMRRLSRPLLAPVGEMLGELLPSLVAAFRQDGIFRAPLLASLAQSALVAVAQTGAEADLTALPVSARRMIEFETLLRADHSLRWGPTEFASALGITAGHLNRLCRAATGTTAARHIDVIRMSEASRLLAFTQLSIAEIGYRLGYDDPSYFSRRYRLAMGETPSQYRQRMVA